jgi:hypothetical protein
VLGLVQAGDSQRPKGPSPFAPGRITGARLSGHGKTDRDEARDGPWSGMSPQSVGEFCGEESFGVYFWKKPLMAWTGTGSDAHVTSSATRELGEIRC